MYLCTFSLLIVWCASLPYNPFIRSIICVTTLLSTCDLSILSTCYNTMHSITLIILLATYQSKGLMVRPQLFRLVVRFFQKSCAACSVPYKSFLSLTYMTLLPFSFCRYEYIFGPSLTISSANLPFIFMCILPPMYACINALEIAIIPTSHFLHSIDYAWQYECFSWNCGGTALLFVVAHKHILSLSFFHTVFVLGTLGIIVSLWFTC